jgi:hypothetical protein
MHSDSLSGTAKLHDGHNNYARKPSCFKQSASENMLPPATRFRSNDLCMPKNVFAQWFMHFIQQTYLNAGNIAFNIAL